MKNTTTRRELFTSATIAGRLATATDAEAVETLLYTVTNSNNAATKAAKLLETFGSYNAVMNADPDALANEIGRPAAEKIRMIRNLATRYTTDAADLPERITNRNILEAYCRRLIGGERKECFYVICVDAQCRLLGARMISVGTLSEVSAYPRSVVETALNLNAHSVFFTHNHPGGTCAPSAEDIASTIQIQRLLNGIGILVLDHVIVAGQSCYSMSQHGDMDFRTRAR